MERLSILLLMKMVLFVRRFDLIFLMLDPQDELYDRRLATHLVSLYHQTQEEEEEEYLVSLIKLTMCPQVIPYDQLFISA